MAFQVFNSNKNISGSLGSSSKPAQLKIEGENNDIDVTLKSTDKNQFWVTGDDNKDFQVRNRGAKGQARIDGSYNTGNINNSQANGGQTIIKGSYNELEYTGSSKTDTFSLGGANNELTRAVFNNSADTLTTVGQDGEENRVRNTSMGNGADRVNSRYSNISINGGSGDDTIYAGRGTTGAITGFEKVIAGDMDLGTKNIADILQKGSDGKYKLIGDDGLELNLGSDGNTQLKFRDGSYKTLSEWLGATTPTGNGSLPATTNNADTIELEAKDYANGTLDLKAGDDRLHVTDGAHNFNAKGGIGTDDQVQFEKAVDDYDNISFDNGKFTFKDANGKTFTVDDTFEKFKFNNEMLTLQQLKDHIKPFATTANADTLDLAGTANKYKKNVNFIGGDDTATLKNDASGYTLDGGDGTGDLLKLSGFTFANLKAQTNWNGSGNGISGLNINGNAISNFEKFDASGLTNTAATPTAGSLFTNLQDFIAWLTAV